jgi:heme/copper-type cytochrome/quinol oxidase subunit 2
MPIAVKAVSKADFKTWLVDAKKKFAAAPAAPTADSRGTAVLAAAVQTAAAGR